MAGAAVAKNSFAVLVESDEEAAEIVNRLAPEHLEVQTAEPEKLCEMINHYGALFIGPNAAEVLGDYGAGPNHTLPTGGTARSYGGLSVHTFLRLRTSLKIDDLDAARVIVQDSVDLAISEGLIGHSRAAALRLPGADLSPTPIPQSALDDPEPALRVYHRHAHVGPLLIGARAWVPTTCWLPDAVVRPVELC